MTLDSLTVRQMRALLAYYGGAPTDTVEYALTIMRPEIAAIAETLRDHQETNQ